MPPIDRPPAELDVDEALVRTLLDEQHPDLAARSLVEVASGWDNVIYRLGDDLVVRLPRREVAAELVVHEQRWLPELASRLPLPIAAPVRVGRPGSGYPWPWSITPWFDGTVAAIQPPADLEVAADGLGAFLQALHRPAPTDAPVNPFRGVPLDGRAALFEQHAALLPADVDHRAVRSCWEGVVGIPSWPGPPVWVHGDLHPANIIVRDGRLAAVIDFGDLTAGDPATDLAVAWMLFPPAVRERWRPRPIGPGTGPVPDADTWDRARGWAFALGVACLANSADQPVIAGIGRRAVAEVLADRSGP